MKDHFPPCPLAKTCDLPKSISNILRDFRFLCRAMFLERKFLLVAQQAPSHLLFLLKFFSSFIGLWARINSGRVRRALRLCPGRIFTFRPVGTSPKSLAFSRLSHDYIATIFRTSQTCFLDQRLGIFAIRESRTRQKLAE